MSLVSMVKKISGGGTRRTKYVSKKHRSRKNRSHKVKSHKRKSHKRLGNKKGGNLALKAAAVPFGLLGLKHLAFGNKRLSRRNRRQKLKKN